MLKYLFFTLLFCVSTPCFCSINQSTSATFTSVFNEKNLGEKHQKVFSKQNFLKKTRLDKRFPIFGVVSMIATYLGIALLAVENFRNYHWTETASGILILLGLCLGIVGLVIGEFWLWAFLGSLFLPILILLMMAIFGTGSC
jgi:hypothetical protein